MGSGKSTIGKKLARMLNMNFADLDACIEKESGKTISEIFESEGEKKFRLLEKKYLKEIVKKDNLVISLGGGTPCFNNNIELINQTGISIYLKTDVDTLVKRLIKAKKKRPLIEEMNEMDLKKFIKKNLMERLPYYEKAIYKIKTSEQSPDELALEIIKLIQ